jgi:hypothetical protein
MDVSLRVSAYVLPCLPQTFVTLERPVLSALRTTNGSSLQYLKLLGNGSNCRESKTSFTALQNIRFVFCYE